MITIYVIAGILSGKRYVGITNNIKRRLSQHRSGATKGGQQLGAFRLVYTEQHPTYNQAREREKYLKSRSGRRWLDGQLPNPSLHGSAG